MFSLSLLPHGIQLAIGRGIGALFYRIGGSRKKVAMRNIELCFPEKSAAEQEALVKDNFANTGIAMMEMGMGWFWPNWRMKKYVQFEGEELIKQAQNDGKGVLILTMHFTPLEMCCRVFGMVHPAVAFYRPHNNKVMEFFQYRGRARANRYLIGKRDVKGLFRALKDKEACLYLPDQDYGRNRSVFVPFFSVEQTASTTGTLLFARSSNCKVLVAMPYRTADNRYKIEIHDCLPDFPSKDNDIEDVTRVNQMVEHFVRQHPEQYLWVHRRFKTRPNKDDPSLYK